MPHLFKRKYVRNHRNSVVMNGLSPKEADVQSDTSSHIEGIILLIAKVMGSIFKSKSVSHLQTKITLFFCNMKIYEPRKGTYKRLEVSCR